MSKGEIFAVVTGIAVVAAIIKFVPMFSYNPVEVIPEPVTIQFECLIVDREGQSVHAVIEVEQEDVITLITGDQWQFMSRMEER